MRIKKASDLENFSPWKIAMKIIVQIAFVQSKTVIRPALILFKA
jgi:hypothetical protein